MKLLLLLLLLPCCIKAQKKDTCHCNIDYNGLAITYNARWKCYLVNNWYGERRFLCYNSTYGSHFTYPEDEAPYRFKTLREAERTYEYNYLNGYHQRDLKTIKGTEAIN